MGTPDYLKPRKVDSKALAKMYEADDHVLFGHSRSMKNSETASQRSSQRGSVQGSAKRKRSKRRNKSRRGIVGETGTDPFSANVMDFPAYSDAKLKGTANTMEIVQNSSSNPNMVTSNNR